MPNGHGFIYEDLADEDYVFGSTQSLGAKFQGKPLKEDGDWRPHVPTDNELQAPTYETNGCASFGTFNAIETLKRFLGIVDNYSDRMLAKLSGTDPTRGNTPKKVADTLKKKWSVREERWPATAAKTVEEFYAEVPKNLQDLALAEGAEFDFGYERVNTDSQSIAEALKYSPLGMSVPAWWREGEEYYRPQGYRDNHWVCCVYQYPDGRKVILDTYAPFIKTLKADFVPEMVMGYYLNKNVVVPSAWEKFLSIIRQLFDPASLGAVRSPKWSQVRKAHLALYRDCAVCESKEDLEVHHIVPFNKDPSLELEPKNLITLCADHHLFFGHLGSYKSYNMLVAEDAKTWRERRTNRP